MRRIVYRCDVCRCHLSEGDESRERCFTLQTPFRTWELDICRDCWTKMCAAVGLNPTTRDDDGGER